MTDPRPSEEIAREIAENLCLCTTHPRPGCEHLSHEQTITAALEDARREREETGYRRGRHNQLVWLSHPVNAIPEINQVAREILSAEGRAEQAERERDALREALKRIAKIHEPQCWLARDPDANPADCVCASLGIARSALSGSGASSAREGEPVDGLLIKDCPKCGVCWWKHRGDDGLRCCECNEPYPDDAIQFATPLPPQAPAGSHQRLPDAVLRHILGNPNATTGRETLDAIISELIERRTAHQPNEPVAWRVVCADGGIHELNPDRESCDYLVSEIDKPGVVAPTLAACGPHAVLPLYASPSPSPREREEPCETCGGSGEVCWCGDGNRKHRHLHAWERTKPCPTCSPPSQEDKDA